MLQSVYEMDDVDGMIQSNILQMLNLFF